MKRRDFTTSVIAGLGVSSLPAAVSFAAQKPGYELCKKSQVVCDDGLVLKLEQVTYPSKIKDDKQFILTYRVDGFEGTLEERVYHLKVNEQAQQIYMTPINNNQLQAVFNWRLNA